MYAIHAWYDPLGRVPATFPLASFKQGCLRRGAIRIASQLSSFEYVLSIQPFLIFSVYL